MTYSEPSPVTTGSPKISKPEAAAQRHSGTRRQGRQADLTGHGGKREYWSPAGKAGGCDQGHSAAGVTTELQGRCFQMDKEKKKVSLVQNRLAQKNGDMTNPRDSEASG